MGSNLSARSKRLLRYGRSAVAFVLTAAFVACPNSHLSVLSPSFDEIVSEGMEKAKVPGFSLAVLDHGRIGPIRTFGFKSLATREPVTDSTVFEACSLSKPVFAYAVLSLVGEGRLDLDRPLLSYVPQDELEREFFRGPLEDERMRRITARMVLSHRTGFPNWREGPILSLLFDPGDRFGYSGEGYVFLQAVVERLTGQPAQDFARQRVFDPLGMIDSSFVWQDDFEARAASPHSSSGEIQPIHKRMKANAAGSLYTTSLDFARFLLALLDGPGLSDRLRTEMFSKQTNVSPGIDWGLGVALERVGGVDYIWHWGDNPGFKSFFLISRKERSGFVYFSNGDSGLCLAWNLTRRLVGADHPILASALLEKYRIPGRTTSQNVKAPAAKPGVRLENSP